MKLNYKVFGVGKPVIILHGLFGMLDNWQQFAKQLSIHHKVYILDLRNHGKSPHSDIFNYDVMVEDLALFIETHKINNPNLIGHSMGGKLALKFSIYHPHLINKTLVIDIGIKKYTPMHTSILTALNSLDLKVYLNRKQIDEALKSMIPKLKIRQFLLKNIARNIDETGYRWKINISAITKSYHKIIDALDIPSDFKTSCLFIKGEQSDYILEEDKKAILSHIPNARFVTIQNSGHWLHAEQPRILLKVIEDELSQP